MDLLRRIMRYDPVLVIKTLSLMLINIKNPLWISFIMIHPLVAELVASHPSQSNEELIEYYISFLKSISIRLDIDTLPIFFNKVNPKAKTLMNSRAIEIQHLPPGLRSSQVLQPPGQHGQDQRHEPRPRHHEKQPTLSSPTWLVKSPRLNAYFGKFPFQMYIVHFCCSLSQHWTALDRVFKNVSKHRAKMQISDQHDSLYYLYDLYQYGNQRVINVLRNSITAYCLFPVLFKSLLGRSGEGYVSPKLALFMLNSFLRIYKDSKLTVLICYLLFSPNIPKLVLQKIQNPIQWPKSFSAQFDSEKPFYWDAFSYEIADHCESLFHDIANFETDHEILKKEGQQPQSDFLDEVKRLSNFVGLQLLEEGDAVDNSVDMYLDLFGPTNQQSCENPIKKTIIHLLEDQQRYPGSDDSLLWLATNMVLVLQRKTEISNVQSISYKHLISHYVYLKQDVLKHCGLLTPKLDLFNYKSNLLSLAELFKITLAQLKNYPCHRPVTVRNLAVLLSTLHCPEIVPHNTPVCLLQIYQDCLSSLKSMVKPQNTNILVEYFLEDYKKWTFQFHTVEPLIPFSVFLSADEAFPQIKEEQHMPTNTKEELCRKIILFAIMSHLSKTYFPLLHEHDFKLFEESYQARFNQTIARWKLGKKYHIENRHMIECRVVHEKNSKKPRFTNCLIVEDPFSLLLVEPSSDNETATILLNVKYKMAEISLEGSGLVINWRTQIQKGETSLVFNNNVLAQGAYNKITRNAQEALQDEQMFIHKYLQGLHKSLRVQISDAREYLNSLVTPTEPPFSEEASSYLDEQNMSITTESKASEIRAAISQPPNTPNTPKLLDSNRKEEKSETSQEVVEQHLRTPYSQDAETIENADSQEGVVSASNNDTSGEHDNSSPQDHSNHSVSEEENRNT